MAYANAIIRPIFIIKPALKMRMRHLASLAFLLLVAACSSVPKQSVVTIKASDSTRGHFDRHDNTGDLIVSLKNAEEEADEIGRKILMTGRDMTIDKQVIVKGSCWDYCNAVYTRSGYQNDKTSRVIVFKGTKAKGPFADAKLIKPGDWLFYVNHSYNGIEHSAIFVKWIDFGSRNALMLSYGGEKRNEPARYLTYELTKVYQIIRPNAKSG